MLCLVQVVFLDTLVDCVHAPVLAQAQEACVVETEQHRNVEQNTVQQLLQDGD